jgi:hypothetical protein
MGHFCRICGRVRANEKFSGRGHRDHVCKDCQHKPRAQRDRIERLDELSGFLRQSIISAKNQARLQILCQHADSEVRLLAELIRDIARAHPGRRRRVQTIARRHWPLFVRMVATLSEEWWDDYFVDHMGDAGADWLYERFEAAQLEPYGQAPCLCGSGVAYWQCCAERDEVVASEFLSEQSGW